MSDPADPSPQARTLAWQARVLTDRVVALNESVERLDARANRSARVLAVAVVGVVLGLILSVAVAVTLSAQGRTDARLEAEIAEQARIRSDALCPLYALLVGSYNPGSRAEGEDRRTYEDAFVTLRAAYTALGCAASSPVVPPAAPR